MTTVQTKRMAKDVMTPEPVCVERSTTIRQLARVFEENEISGAPVVDGMGRVVGMVSKTDLIRKCSEGTAVIPPAYLFEMISEQGGEDLERFPESSICVEDLMTEDPVTVTAHTHIAEIAHRMAEDRIHRVVVVDDSRSPLGIVTSLDVLRVFPRSV